MSFPLMPFGGVYNPVSSTSVFNQVENTASTTIVVPSNTLPGDLLILAEAANFTYANPTVVFPSGFTLLTSYGFTSGASSGVAMSAKIATLSDAGSTLTGMTGDQGNAKSLLVVRGNIRIDSFSAVINSSGTYNSGTPSNQTAVGTGVTAPAIVIGVAAATALNFGNLPFATQSPSFTTTSSPGGSGENLIQGFSSIATGASAFSQTVGMADKGNNTLLVFWLQVR